LEAMGVEVRTGKMTAALTGNGTVTGVRFSDGATLDADMVVISCGIRANIAEAREAGLEVERGILVDDQMRTSDPDVFAVGECAQHKGVCAGLVEPCYEQARVLADVLTGTDPSAAYRGWRPAATLKVMGVDLLSMGEVQAADAEVVSHLDAEAGAHRKLVVPGGPLRGAILPGIGAPAGAVAPAV